jgi:hypothetical protein
MTLGVVVLRSREINLEIGLDGKGADVVQQHIGTLYAPNPFEPCAIEEVSHADAQSAPNSRSAQSEQ